VLTLGSMQGDFSAHGRHISRQNITKTFKNAQVFQRWREVTWHQASLCRSAQSCLSRTRRALLRHAFRLLELELATARQQQEAARRIRAEFSKIDRRLSVGAAFRQWRGLVQVRAGHAAKARQVAGRLRGLRRARLLHGWRWLVVGERLHQWRCRCRLERGRRCALGRACSRWQEFVDLCRERAASEEKWRTIFRKIERAWDRGRLLRIVRLWHDVADAAALVAWEQAVETDLGKAAAERCAAVQQLAEVREQLECALASAHRLAALDTLCGHAAPGSSGGGASAGGAAGHVPTGGHVLAGGDADLSTASKALLTPTKPASVTHSPPGGGTLGGNTPGTPGGKGWISVERLSEAVVEAGGSVEGYLLRLEGERVRLEHLLLSRTKDLARERSQVQDAGACAGAGCILYRMFSNTAARSRWRP